MCKKKVHISKGILLTQAMISGFIFSYLQTTVNAKSEIVLYSIKPARIKPYLPHPVHYDTDSIDSDLSWKLKEHNIEKFFKPVENVLQIKSSDAIDGIKYSQPDVTYSLLYFKRGLKVPSTDLKERFLKNFPNQRSENFQGETVSTGKTVEKNTTKLLKDIGIAKTEIKLQPEISENKLKTKIENTSENEMFDKEMHYTASKKNFTDTSDNLVPVSSNAVMSYSPSEFNHSSVKENISNSMIGNKFSNINSSIILSTLMTKYTTQNSISINTHVYIELMNQTATTDNISFIPTAFPTTQYINSFTNSPSSIDSERKFSSGSVAGIVIAALVSITLISSAVIYLLYKKFNGKCTNVVDTKFNSDNCGYLDDSLHSSIYLNNHIELPKESSEEMTSLDNDSFLNSLETMTIQNYWADSSKNTKV